MGKARVAVSDVFVVLGICAGFVFAAFGPQTYTSQTLVRIASPLTAHVSTATEVVIAGSEPVLTGAMQRIGHPVALASLRREVTVRGMADGVISISAQGPTAASAEDTASAVAYSFTAYDSKAKANGPVQALLLAPAVTASQAPLSHRALVPCGLGGLIGAVTGGLTVAISRRFRMR
jgi:capsular polysaccharide biosynthesis protein